MASQVGSTLSVADLSFPGMAHVGERAMKINVQSAEAIQVLKRAISGASPATDDGNTGYIVLAPGERLPGRMIFGKIPRSLGSCRDNLPLLFHLGSGGAVPASHVKLDRALEKDEGWMFVWLELTEQAFEWLKAQGWKSKMVFFDVTWEAPQIKGGERGLKPDVDTRAHREAARLAEEGRIAAEEGRIAAEEAARLEEQSREEARLAALNPLVIERAREESNIREQQAAAGMLLAASIIAGRANSPCSAPEAAVPAPADVAEEGETVDEEMEDINLPASQILTDSEGLLEGHDSDMDSVVSSTTEASILLERINLRRGATTPRMDESGNPLSGERRPVTPIPEENEPLAVESKDGRPKGGA